MNNWLWLPALCAMISLCACGEAPPANTGGSAAPEMAMKAAADTGNKAAAGAVGASPIVLMWQVQKDAPDGDFATLAAAGVTLVQSFRLATWPEKDVVRYLDGAAAAGLGVAVSLNVFLEGSDANCMYKDDAFRFIARFKAHPAVFAWHLVDEPAEHAISADCQRALYRAVKNVDPQRNTLITTNNNSRAKYREFFAEDAFDILEMHKYVNPRPTKKEQNLVDLLREFRTRDYPVIITFRAFNSPHRERREDMVPGSLAEQYAFFIEQGGITPHFGFYGWDLAPNQGIKALPELRVEFDALMAARRAASR